MRRLLILSVVPKWRAWQDDPRMTDRHCRRISTSPQLSSVLTAKGIPHRNLGDYCALTGWDEIHAVVTRQLHKLAVASSPRLHATWLDDWSHLIVDEVRNDVFWGELAKRLLRKERPKEVWLQRVASSHPAAPQITVLTRELTLRGMPPRSWVPGNNT